MNRLAVFCGCLMSFFCNPASGQLESELNQAEQLLQKCLLEISELSDDHCAKFTGQISTIYRRDSRPLLSEIQGYSVVSYLPFERYHSFVKLQIEPQLLPTQSLIHEALRFRDPSKTILISGKNLPLSRKEQLEKKTKSWTRFRSEPGKETDKWTWPEIDPCGMVFTTGNAWTSGDLSSLHIQLGLLQSIKNSESKVSRNGDVRGKWLSGNGKASVEIVFSKESNFMPISIRTAPAGNAAKGSVFETRTKWKESNRVYFPVANTLTYIESGSFGERESQLDVKWFWLPEKIWHGNRLSFEELTKDDPEVELIPHIEKLFTSNTIDLIYEKSP